MIQNEDILCMTPNRDSNPRPTPHARRYTPTAFWRYIDRVSELFGKIDV